MLLDALLIKTHNNPTPQHALKKKFLLAKIYICIYRFIPLKPYENGSRGFSFCPSYIPMNRSGKEIHRPAFFETKRGVLSGVSRYPAALCEEV